MTNIRKNVMAEQNTVPSLKTSFLTAYNFYTNIIITTSTEIITKYVTLCSSFNRITFLPHCIQLL
jgi:hypothetical protein